MLIISIAIVNIFIIIIIIIIIIIYRNINCSFKVVAEALVLIDF